MQQNFNRMLQADKLAIHPFRTAVASSSLMLDKRAESGKSVLRSA